MSNKSPADVEHWLVNYVANQLSVACESIDPDEDLVNLGLSSRQAIMLAANLESYIDKPTDPALIWEYPTIRQLAQHLGRSS